MESQSTTVTLDVPITPLPSEKPSVRPSKKLSSSTSPMPVAAAKSNFQCADAFIQRLSRCVSTRAGADTTLMFVCYASRLVGASLEHIGRAATQQNARDLIALALKLPPQASVKLSENPVYSPLVSLALRLAARLKNLAAVVSEVRTFNRLFGLLGLYLLGRRIATEGSKDDKDAEGRPVRKPFFDRSLAVAQLIALVSFQVTENVAYLSAKKVLPFQPATQGKLARWSVRSWSAYIFMEAARLLMKRRRALAKGSVATLEWELGWQKEFFRNLAWAPLTLHWSVDNGPLNDFAIGALAMWPAAGGMNDLWRANA